LGNVGTAASIKVVLNQSGGLRLSVTHAPPLPPHPGPGCTPIVLDILGVLARPQNPPLPAAALTRRWASQHESGRRMLVKSHVGTLSRPELLPGNLSFCQQEASGSRLWHGAALCRPVRRWGGGLQSPRPCPIQHLLLEVPLPHPASVAGGSGLLKVVDQN
jgi:hypothetical protein